MLNVNVNTLGNRFKLNTNDMIIFLFFIGFIWLYMYGWSQMHAGFSGVNSVAPISLNPEHLPYYTLRSTIRLLIGLVFSLIFALVVGYACAKNKHFARVMLPIINFLESAPLLGFLTFTTIFFLFLFPNNLMGLEAAAIFGVFTSQAWNMALIIYQTLRIIPKELNDAAKIFKLNAWQKFWKIEMPYSVPGLLWNTMVSQSAAWFAIVATEAIPIGNKSVMLPGLGSYIQLALDKANIAAIVYALLAIIITIIFFDQFFFRPLVKWSEKFKFEGIRSRSHNSSWVADVLKNGVFTKKIKVAYKIFTFYWQNLPTMFAEKISLPKLFLPRYVSSLSVIAWYGFVVVGIMYGFSALWGFFPDGNMTYLLPLMLETAARVAIAMILSVIIFTPIAIWIGLNPKLTRIFQPIAQVGAAIPQPIFFPLIAVVMVVTGTGLNGWTIFLIMTGTSWYVLFNVIAGASSLPNDMLEMVKSFNMSGLKWWFKFAIPATFPYLVTGIISAAGGAWNSAIAAELIQWGSKTISVNGLGNLISQTTADGKLPQAALACFALVLLVACCVYFIWKPLYRLAETRYKI